jgi:hypothetical protein
MPTHSFFFFFFFFFYFLLVEVEMATFEQAGRSAEREEEYEVLTSIYGESVLLVVRDDVEGDVVKYVAENYVITCLLPGAYPEEACPVIKIRLVNNSGSSTRQIEGINRKLEELLEGGKGQVVLYQAIECIREGLEQDVAGSSSNNSNNNHDEESYYSGLEHIEENVYEYEDTDAYADDYEACGNSTLASCHLNIIHGETLIERKSSFQSHICAVSSMEEVHEFRRHVLSDRRIARATHNIFAYRFTNTPTGVCYHDNDDDGETAAGARLAEMIRLMGVDGVAVIVSRWFGGTLLGPDRFKYICNSARKLLEDNGYGKPSATTKKKR